MTQEFKTSGPFWDMVSVEPVPLSVIIESFVTRTALRISANHGLSGQQAIKLTVLVVDREGPEDGVDTLVRARTPDGLIYVLLYINDTNTVTLKLSIEDRVRDAAPKARNGQRIIVTLNEFGKSRCGGRRRVTIQGCKVDGDVLTGRDNDGNATRIKINTITDVQYAE